MEERNHEEEYATEAHERFKDLCEYFHNDEYAIQHILCDRDEFKKWLERLKWNVKKCDELGREIEEFRRCNKPKVADKDALIAVLTKLRDASSDISKYTDIDRNEIYLQLEEALKLAELSDKTNNMTASHSEYCIYRGCLHLMDELKDSFYTWLDDIGYDITELDEDEQFSKRFTATEIVRALFLEHTRHSGGTSCFMKCNELGIDSGEEIYFDFLKELSEIEENTIRE